MIEKLSRGYWEIAVKHKGCDPIILRDYDIIKDRERGLTLGQLAIKYNMTKMNVIKILTKR